MRINYRKMLLEIFILLVCFRGFIDNFVGYGTLLVDGFVLLLLFILFIIPKQGNSNNKALLRSYLIWCFLCLLDVFIQLIIERTTVNEAILAFRNDVLYTTPLLFCMLAIKESSLREIYSLIKRVGIIICIFAIFQYVGRNSLPLKFLVLNGEGTFGLWNTDIVRVTGLMGNTIIFGGFTVIIACLIFAELLFSKNERFERKVFIFIQLSITMIANILTFSRGSNVGMVLVLLIEYYIYMPQKNINIFLQRTLIIIFVSCFILVLAFTIFEDSVVMQRILGTNGSWTTGSDNIHFSTIENAIPIILQNAILGYGIGKVGYSAVLGVSTNIVRDGTFWIYLLEWGIPISLFYWSVQIKAIKKSYKNISINNIKGMLSLALICMNIYLIVFGVINSAYSARCNLIFISIIEGLVYCRGDNCDDRENWSGTCKLPY